MDLNTCKSALAIAEKCMTSKQFLKFQSELRKQYLSSEVSRVQSLLARKVQPVNEFRELSAVLPILQQQLASVL